MGTASAASHAACGGQLWTAGLQINQTQSKSEKFPR